MSIGEFSHFYSCNLGAQSSNGKYLVFLNGHSIPVSNTWLEDGLKDFENDKVAGVFSFVLPQKGAPLFEKTF